MPAPTLTLLDRAIASVAPHWGLRRAQARAVLAYYEAAKPNRQRRQRTATGSINLAIRAAGTTLRDQARHMEQNNPQVRSILRVLTNNVIGPNGIGIEPSPKRRDGTLHRAFSDALAARYARWSDAPDVTGELDRAECERLAFRSVLRDGECLAKLIEGIGPTAPHSTPIPFSVQLLEADHLPLGYDGTARVADPAGERIYPIIDGIELNAWGARRAYWLHDRHPGDIGPGSSLTDPTQLRRVDANRVLHLLCRDRIHQRRGVSIFPSVLEVLEDLWQYEESEQVAAKVAASLGAMIVKGSPDFYRPEDPVAIGGDAAPGSRELRMSPGTIFDDLRPGESVSMIGTNGRPNPALVDFRFAMLRKIAAATGVSFSSIARYYHETYSGQRQELIESWVDYAVLSSWFIAAYVRPVWARFVSACLLTDLAIPADLDPATVADALYIPPSMPWIDPQKEATAWTTLEQAGHASGPEIIRRRGQSPTAVRDQEIAWRQSWREQGEQITADPASADIATVPGWALSQDPDHA